MGIIEGIMCAMVPEGIMLTISGLCGDSYKLLVYLKEARKGKSFESKYKVYKELLSLRYLCAWLPLAQRSEKGYLAR